MEKTLAVLNQMVAEGVLEKYAIGGAIGATFYLEPIATQDLDIFTILPQKGLLITLEPIYAYLKNKGYISEGEYIVIEGWPVQFLPASNALVQEAIEAAISARLNEVPTRVMAAEFLVAMALQTGRAKDFLRIQQFIEGNVIDKPLLNTLLERHGLVAAWQKFSDRYPN
jgi:hypothetical protein